MVETAVDSKVEIQVIRSISQVDAKEWDDLSAAKPFQSHGWYRFGEQVMSDCQPIYLLAYTDGELIGRVSLWVVRDEPLPQSAGNWRALLKLILRKWPLLICRSPLANTTGLVVSEACTDRKAVIHSLVEAALAQGIQEKCSILLFDYLSKSQREDLPAGISTMEAADPGNVLYNEWQDFDQYLARGGKKARQRYHRTVREMESLHVTITRTTTCGDINQLLPLVHNIENQYGAPQNPWMAGMFSHLEMANGVLLTARLNEKPVGCLLLLEDGDGQIATGFGRAHDLPYVYFMLFYESICTAMERKIKFLRWGSGAYETKRRLGFKLEDNSVIAFMPIQPILRKITKIITLT